MAKVGAWVALVAAAGCTGAPRTDSGWVLRRGQDTATPAWLGNGRIGLRFRPDGGGVPGRAFRESLREPREERLLGADNPFAVELFLDGRLQRPAAATQELDLRTGVLRSKWTLQGLRVLVESVVHPTEAMASTVWTVEGAPIDRVELRPTSALARRPSWAAPESPPVELDWESAEWRDASTGRVGIAVGGVGKDHHARVRAAAEDAARRRWATDIVIVGPTEDQASVRAALHYLRAQSGPGMGGLSPMGLSNLHYGGHTFWDADVWVLPALALIDPEGARQIPRYRLARLAAARLNARAKGAPLGAAAYPWESGPSGREVGATGHTQAAHVSGSVALGLELAARLGLAEATAVEEAGSSIARYYRWRSRPDGDTVLRTIGPDEGGMVDGDLYTNCLAEWVRRRFGGEPHATYRRPRRGATFLGHEGDDLRPRKQASALLAVFPLQDERVEAELLPMLERFAGRTVPEGPAMSASVEALLWARAGRADRGYEAWLDATRPYGRALGLLNEKRNRIEDRTQFATGAAGALNAVVYGFLGFRIDDAPQPGAIWQAGLRGNAWISVRPCLPRAWKSVTFRNFRVLGRTYTLTVDHHTAKVEQGVP